MNQQQMNAVIALEVTTKAVLKTLAVFVATTQTDPDAALAQMMRVAQQVATEMGLEPAIPASEVPVIRQRAIESVDWIFTGHTIARIQPGANTGR